MSAVSEINLNHLILMVLIIKDRDSFLSQAIEEVISESSTSVSSLEIPSFCDGLAKTRQGWIQKTLKDSLLISLGFIKVAGEGKERKKYPTFARDQEFHAQIILSPQNQDKH